MTSKSQDEGQKSAGQSQPRQQMAEMDEFSESLIGESGRDVRGPSKAQVDNDQQS